MSFDDTLLAIAEKAPQMDPIGASLKFDFGDQLLFIDGKGTTNEVSREDKAADCTITISPDNLVALIKGELNPMMAVMSGKVKIKGDMSVAMKLQSLLS